MFVKSVAMKIQKIKWRDSRMYITQTDRDTDYQPCIIESIGYVVENTKDHITLAGDLVDDDYRRVLVIPKENIL